MSHRYSPECDCKRCFKEQARRAAQSAYDPRNRPKSKRRQTRARRHVASQEEQHARYLDCGPAAWDDRD